MAGLLSDADTKKLTARLNRLEKIFSEAHRSAEVERRRSKVRARIDTILNENDRRRRLVFVAMIPRSGSTLLGEALRQTEAFGSTREWLNPNPVNNIVKFVDRYGTNSRSDYLDFFYNFSATANAIASMKCSYMQALPFLYDNLLMECFDEVQFVYQTRENVLEQAVSFYKASQSGQWSTLKSEGTSALPGYNAEGILNCLNELLDMQKSWEIFFHTRGILPLRMSYEQLESDLDGQIRRLSALMNIPPPAPLDQNALKIQKQRDDITAQWVDQFTEDMGSLIAKTDERLPPEV